MKCKCDCPEFQSNPHGKILCEKCGLEIRKEFYSIVRETETPAPTMIQTPPEVLAPLNHEREHGGRKYGVKARPVGEQILLMEKYLEDAKTAWTSFKGDDAALHELRKLGAVVIQCFVDHGCPWRGSKVKNGHDQHDLPQHSQTHQTPPDAVSTQ